MIQVKSSNNSHKLISLPDLVLVSLSQYLKQNDLIELSKACKNYRNHLKPCVLRALTIPYNPGRIYNNSLFDSSEGVEAIVKCLEQDFKGCYQMVKEVVILDSSISNQLISCFINTFPLIENITINSSDYKSLLEILSRSSYINHITLYSNFSGFKLCDTSSSYKFFHQLKAIKLRTPSHIIIRNSPFDMIDSSFSNLKCLTIISSNILNNISTGLASLAAAEFQGYSFDKAEISKFISNNPQLKKLEISTGHLNEEVVSSILNSEKLIHLYIKDSSWNDENELNVSAENYCINHFKYTGNGYNKNIVRIINLCKCLIVFEICDIALLSSFVNTVNDSFTEIDTLLISSSFDIYSIELLLKLKKFKQIKFRGVCKFIDLNNKIKRLRNCRWVPKCDYSIDTDEFKLIRKL